MDPLSHGPWPNFSDAEGELVKEVLMSNRVNYWTGDRGKAFEKAFADATDCHHAIALANGTLALDLALIGLGIGAGDEVVVTPRSFMASASVVENAGARAVFADVDPVSQNITVESISAVLTDRTKAVICVHLAGWPCDMDPIMEMAGKNGLAVIEDCAQAHGARYKGRSVGSIGHVAAWSFCQDKIMTTGGEGGMVTTNDDRLFERMWAYKDHGKSREKMFTPSTSRSFKYIHDQFGSNFRMTEMQAALGRYQLQRLSGWQHERARNAKIYNHELSSLEIVRTTEPPTNVQHAYYKYYCFLNLHQLGSGWDRDRIVGAVNDNGGQCFSGCCPELYLEGAFVGAYGILPTLASAHKLGKESLMLNIHPGIGDDFIEANIRIIKSVLISATDGSSAS